MVSLTSLKSLRIIGEGKVTSLPATLSKLEIVADSLSINQLPRTITQLNLAAKLNMPLHQFLHPNLSYLAIRSSVNFNEPVHLLPPNLTHLRISSPDFDQPLDHLPSSLLELTIDEARFNQPLNHLPTSLLGLTDCSCQFDQALDYLPPSLIHLSLPFYNEPLNHLPNSLTSLCMSEQYSQPLLHLPPALCILKVNVRKVKMVLPPFVSVVHLD